VESGVGSAPEATVYVVDDDAEVRTGLSRLLRSVELPVSAFGAAQDFLDQISAEAIGCIVLDINMPGMSGTELHELLEARGIDMPVLYLTGQGSVPTAVKAMKLGALEYFEKPVDAKVFLEAVALAIEGHRQRRVEQARHRDLASRVGSLSCREREVMEHVIRGRLNKQIAGDLGIAEKTVKVHRGRVMHKIGVRSVAQLVRLCEELGIRKAE
jgi:FixJ family two-component response regulator